MSGWHCPTCGTINNTADERGNCKCERDRLVGMLERITASDECDPSVKLRQELDTVTRQLDVAIHALRRIYQPVRYAVEDCPPDQKPDGYWIQRIAADPSYYQQKAGDALDQICKEVDRG